MSILKLEDGRAVEVVEEWREGETWDGNNHVGRFTRSPWDITSLVRTRTGLWVIVPSSSWQGKRPQPYEISPAEAAGWFAACEIDVPEELAEEVL